MPQNKRKARPVAKSRRPVVSKRVRVEKLKIRYKNKNIIGGSEKIDDKEIQQFQTITKDKLKIKRLEKLLKDPLIDQSLARAAVFYASTGEPEKQKPYLDLRIDISEELAKK